MMRFVDVADDDVIFSKITCHVVGKERFQIESYEDEARYGKDHHDPRHAEQ